MLKAQGTPEKARIFLSAEPQNPWKREQKRAQKKRKIAKNKKNKETEKSKDWKVRELSPENNLKKNGALTRTDGARLKWKRGYDLTIYPPVAAEASMGGITQKAFSALLEEFRQAQASEIAPRDLGGAVLRRKAADFRRKPQKTADFCRNRFLPFAVSLLARSYFP